MNKNDQRWLKAMNAGEILGCHQRPERSFFIHNYQFPVCARCTGVLLSAVVAFFLFFCKKIPVTLCLALSSVMLVDWSLQYFQILESTNKRRFVTGFVGGLGYSTLHLYFYRFVFQKIKELGIKTN